MKIAVIGAGAIGSVVAAYLTKTKHDIVLIGREDQVKAIQDGGLKISGMGKDEIFQVMAQTELAQEHDLVIFTTKTQDIERAYQQNHKYLENCFVLTSQNGVQADTILSVHFEPEKMLSSIVMFGATYTKPGEVTYNFPGDWIIGKPYSSLDDDVHKVADILKEVFSVVESGNMRGMKWLKLFVNFNNCIPALVGKSMQETFTDMDMCRLSVLLLREGFEIIQKAGYELESLPNFPVDRIVGLTQMPLDQAAGIINKTLIALSDKPVYGSILQSIKRKKHSEIDFINGEVVQIAKQMEMRATLNEKIVEKIHEIERGCKHLSFDEVKILVGLIPTS